MAFLVSSGYWVMKPLFSKSLMARARLKKPDVRASEPDVYASGRFITMRR